MKNGDGFVPIGDTLQVRVEEDLIFVRNLGLMTLRDLNELIEIYRQVREQHPTLVVMFDCSQGEGIDGAARRAMTGSFGSSVTADATAIFGANFAIRTLGNMIERAVVGLGKPSTGIKFFSTEDEARAFLNIERERALAARDRKPTS